MIVVEIPAGLIANDEAQAGIEEGAPACVSNEDILCDNIDVEFVGIPLVIDVEEACVWVFCEIRIVALEYLIAVCFGECFMADFVEFCVICG